MKKLTILPMVLLAGCTAVGPDFKAPSFDLSTLFVDADQSPTQPDAAPAPVTMVNATSETSQPAPAKPAAPVLADQTWWQDFEDPLLNDLVSRGMTRNLDEAVAVERIREAEANLRATGFNAAIDGSLDGSVQREGGDDTSSSTVKTGSLGASLVLDLFGGIRRERESALASVREYQADVQTARLAWLADLIAAYANARYYQAAVALTEESISAREETVAITRRQYDAGAATEYELAEAEALLATARADVPQYTALFNSNVFAIATLLDEPAAPILAEMHKSAPQLSAAEKAESGVPAELLHNRPDIRSAEANLAAAVADVGVAEADLYPSIELTGTITVTGSATSWLAGPEVSLPIFNRGALAAARDVQISVAKQAEITWRSTVRSAIEDVQIALSNLQQYQKRSEALNAAASSYQRAFDLARENYRNGAITLLDLLDTDRSTAAARVDAASAQNDVAQAWATLQIARGAGAGFAVASK